MLLTKLALGYPTSEGHAAWLLRVVTRVQIFR